jgi:hypothetical protein
MPAAGRAGRLADRGGDLQRPPVGPERPLEVALGAPELAEVLTDPHGQEALADRAQLVDARRKRGPAALPVVPSTPVGAIRNLLLRDFQRRFENGEGASIPALPTDDPKLAGYVAQAECGWRRRSDVTREGSCLS